MKRLAIKWLIAAAVILLVALGLSAFEIRCFGCVPQFNRDIVAHLHDNDLHICVNNFPDKNFRRFILDTYCTDGRNVLSRKQLASITEMNCSGIGANSLKGIEHFTALQKLDCSDNHLETLDPKYMSNLTELDCSNNRLKSLSLYYNRQMQVLNCEHNELTSLSITYLKYLTSVDCSHNYLSNVFLFSDLGDTLTSLDCSYNHFENLGLDRLEKLTDLSISPQNITMSYREDWGVKAVTAYSHTKNRLLSAVTSDGTSLSCYEEKYYLPKGIHDSVLWTVRVAVGSRTAEMQVYSVMKCAHQYDFRIFIPAKCEHCGETMRTSNSSWVRIFRWAFPLGCLLLLFVIFYLHRRKAKGKDWGEVTNIQIHDTDLQQPDRKR